MSLPKSTTDAPRPYDQSIHTNPDAAAWARFFVETWPHVHPDQPVPDEGWMLGWFANAMMAMHDHLLAAPPDAQGGAPVAAPREVCAPGKHRPVSRGILGGFSCARCDLMDYGHGWGVAPPAAPGTEAAGRLCECGHHHLTFGKVEVYDACEKIEECGCSDFVPAGRSPGQGGAR